MNAAEPLAILTTVQQAFEAEHLQQVLENAGIPAYVEGLHCSTNFTFNALIGTIRIRVPERDLERAEQVLEEAQQPRGSDWYCGACAETNDAGFDICWKCGRPRSEVEAEPPAQAEQLPVASHDSISIPYTPVVDNPNPYATPSQHSTALRPPVEATSARAAEEAINNAWKLSVIGLILVPFVTQLISTVILLRTLSYRAPLSQRSQMRFWAAMLINVAALSLLIIWAVMLLIKP
ncbi:MAG: putative signal transducing protein [Aureliella sp.]